MENNSKLDPSELIAKLELMEIKPNTSYIMYIGDTDSLPSFEILDSIHQVAAPFFKDKNCELLVVARHSAEIVEGKLKEST